MVRGENVDMLRGREAGLEVLGFADVGGWFPDYERAVWFAGFVPEGQKG